MNQPPPFPSPSQPQSCGLATWSLVLGIAALVFTVVCIGPLLSIPAVICGHKAMGRIKRSQGVLKGESVALAGLITGYIGIALIPIIMLLSAIAVPNFIRARDTAQRNSCINNLRMIDAAKQQWALEKEKGSAATPTMDDIGQYLGTMQSMPECPKGGDYEINSMSDLPECSIPTHELPR